VVARVGGGTPRAEPVRNRARGRVLVAEDNEVNQVVVCGLLTRAGYTCEVVSNGREAVERLSGTRFDAVLMDCQMPVMDGFEATRRVREAERVGQGRRVPVIALTANAMKGDRERCLEAGMDGYVAKPINPDVLVRAIEECMSRSGAGEGSAFDVGAVLKWSGGNAAVARSILDKFEQHLREDHDLLGASAAGGDGTRTAEIAHSLKGSAWIVQARALADLAASAETAGRAGALEEMSRHVELLREEIARCLAYVPAARVRLEGAEGEWTGGADAGARRG
jgi:CheY-like chemotaxis protein/HPt (histidine-containing phosphotransfer) domain-containing protein